jgi:rfaE bifunctional protein nucleotidyltransferase chain/domain
MKVVFTNGCFDILHVGHVQYLTEARSLGDKLVVGLNSDASVQRLKGSERPVIPQEERRAVLLALRCVDEVHIFDEDTPLKLIQSIRPDVLVKGGDWAVEAIVGNEFVRSYGGEVRSLPFIAGRSTTAIIDKIRRL